MGNFVEIGSGKELEALEKGINAKYGIAGLGEVKWVLGMLPGAIAQHARFRSRRRCSSIRLLTEI
jgi:hypothetical protein